MWSPPPAHAGGVEFPAAGTQSLGRGGANHARPGDPMALLYNPANLAASSGIQLSLQTHLAFYHSCFRRDGTYTTHGNAQNNDWGDGSPGQTELVDGIQQQSESAFNEFGDFPDGRFPEVCNSGPPGVVPELILTWRAHRMVGIGVGFVAPAAVGHTIWGGKQRVGDRRYAGVVDGLPAPTRYNLIEQQLLIAFPTIGIGIAPHPRIRFGAAFGSGFGIFHFESALRAVRGEEFAGDVFSELDATDPFIPRVTASVHAVPHDNLDVFATFTWTQDIEAEGETQLQSGYYRTAIIEELEIPNTTLIAPQPWSLAFGFRYADRIAPRPEDPNTVSQLTGRIEDPMANERWDIEFNVVYERNSEVTEFRALLPNNPARDDGFWIIAPDVGIPATLPNDVLLDHQWKDSWSFRLGGDWNIMPGLAAVRFGLSYETKGVKDGFEQLDFAPFNRIGGHVGLTLRVGRFDISLAYAYIHQFEINRRQGSIQQINADHRLAELACEEDPSCAGLSDEERRRHVAGEANPAVTGTGTVSNFGEGTVINAGRYRSRFNVLSLGLTYHFQ